jgi:hypothetical protein
MKQSVHFGLNTVDAGGYYVGWDGLLKNSEHDVSVMSIMAAMWGFETETIFREKATIERLKLAFQAKASILEPGDWFLLTYSGHGGSNGPTQTLCLYDGEFPDHELHNLVALLRPGVNFVMVADCCHASGLARDYNPFRRVKTMHPSVAEKLKDRPTNGLLDPIQCNAAIFSACLQDQTASDGINQGMWTECLRKSFDEARRHNQLLTWREWFAHAALKADGQIPRIDLMSDSDAYLDSLI